MSNIVAKYANLEVQKIVRFNLGRQILYLKCRVADPDPVGWFSLILGLMRIQIMIQIHKTVMST